MYIECEDIKKYPPRRITNTSIMFFIMAALYGLLSCNTYSIGENIQPPENSHIEANIRFNGEMYAVISGKAYRIDESSRKMTFIKKLYDADFFQKNYTSVNGKLYRISPETGDKYPVLKLMQDDFENAENIHDLINPVRCWTSMTLQGPGAPDVKDYVKLRNRILAYKADYIDNIVEPSTEHAHTGRGSLKLFSDVPSFGMPLTKSSLDTELLYFAKGDHFWFSAWYYLDKGRPTGIMDLESSFIYTSPGMRILFDESLRPRMELKWSDKISYRVPKKNISLQRNKWVNVKVHLFLSDKEDGLVELWIDNEKLISTNGQTLPLPSAVYDRLQIGITANPKGVSTTLYVDDIKISHEP